MSSVFACLSLRLENVYKLQCSSMKYYGRRLPNPAENSESRLHWHQLSAWWTVKPLWTLHPSQSQFPRNKTFICIVWLFIGMLCQSILSLATIKDNISGLSDQSFLVDIFGRNLKSGGTEPYLPMRSGSALVMRLAMNSTLFLMCTCLAFLQYLIPS